VSDNDDIRWRALKAEHSSDVLGPLWLEETERAVRNVSRRYPAAVYTETGSWDEAERQNLVQEVVLAELLEGGQLAYINSVATNLRSIRNLLALTVRRTLAHGRRRTVVDNLLDRCRRLRTDDQPPAGTADAPDSALYKAATEVSRIPRVRIRDSDRAPIVFSTESLEQVLRLVEQHVPGGGSERDLARIFELVLTDYLPGFLTSEEGSDDEPDRTLSPEEEVLTHELVTLLHDGLSPEQRTILAMKLADMSDSAVADTIGISRPTAAKRFKDATAVVSHALRDLEGHLQDAVLSGLASALELPGGHTSSTENEI
jgi:DNA-directed RNA polymerase specialized sigma24 family protein